MLSTAAVLAWNFSTIAHGYFRFDDFDLVSTAHHHRWWETLGRLHGEHFLPLTRVIASVSYPSLFEYNLAVYTPFFETGATNGPVHFAPNAATQDWHAFAVTKVPSLREAVSPEFLHAVAGDPGLQRWYFSSSALREQRTARKREPGTGQRTGSRRTLARGGG